MFHATTIAVPIFEHQAIDGDQPFADYEQTDREDYPPDHWL
jgi:hypothetical protein